jgi:hypothetical protein
MRFENLRAKLTEEDDSFGAAALLDRTIPSGTIQTPLDQV